MGVPPATDAPPELVAGPSAEAQLGAAKFAALLAFMVKMSLDDAVERYGAGGISLPGVGALGGDTEQLKAAVAEFVRARAERCALKYGFGLTIPYEDELVTLGAAAGSSVYLLRKMTGRLPKPGAAAAAADDEPAPPAGDDGADADTSGMYGKIDLEAAKRAQGAR